MVYGIDYCADAECYLKIKNQIKEGIGNIGGIQFAETKELGRVNRIDPLNINLSESTGYVGNRKSMVCLQLYLPTEYGKKFQFHDHYQRRQMEQF